MKNSWLLLAGALTLALTACGQSGGDGPSGAERAAGVWTRAADPPLSARYGPLLAWTGEEVLVVGGHSGPPCPPNADCAMPDDGVRDAAAYGVAGDVWRPLAEPPVDLDRFAGHVVVDGDLVVGTPDAWWTYDVSADAWREVPLPGGVVGVPEAVDGGRVLTHAGRRISTLDLATGAWHELPADPLRPALRGGGVFATGAGVVLTGVSYQEAAPDEPILTQADVWDGTTWRRLPPTGMIGPLLHWTGQRLVGAEVGSADGGEVDGWDRSYPFAGALDPSTGAWSELDDVPGYDDLRDSDWRVEAAEGSLVATAGHVYDDATGTWSRLGHPRSRLTQDLAGVWADGRLVVVGGADDDGDVATETWTWAPE